MYLISSNLIVVFKRVLKKLLLLSLWIDSFNIFNNWLCYIVIINVIEKGLSVV